MAKRWLLRFGKAIKTRVAQLDKAPGLGVVLVGEDPASQVYVRNKLKAW